MRTPILLAVAVVLAAHGLARAQEIEPRSYSPGPVGMNFAGLSVLDTRGGVAVDPTLPLDNVDVRLESVMPGYSRSFGLAGRAASASLAVPYAWGDIAGDVGEDRREVRRAGFGDTRLRVAVNIAGNPARTPAQYAASAPATTLGASLTVVAPTGEYRADRLVNLGTNRWAFKPEVGLYQPLGPWAVELSAGAWFFTDNDDFFGGVRRQQDPLATAQLHVAYTFRPRLWIAASSTWYGGGETTIDGTERADRQDNTRVGLTLSVPVARDWSVKLGWSDGVTTRIGSDFSTVALALQYAWLAGPALPR
ncbi:MAG: transporter [Chromatiales bacterium]|nr:transporter [Chromatiales bacterium]